MMRRTVRGAWAGVLAVLCAVASAGCAPFPRAHAGGPFVGDWKLVQAEVGEARDSVEDAGITLISDGSSAAGFSGCRNYAFQLSGDSGGFRFGRALAHGRSGPAAGSLSTCSEALQRIESRYLAALLAAEGAEVREGELMLTTGDGFLRFEAIPPFPRGELAGTEWVMLARADNLLDRWANEVVAVPTLKFVGADRIVAPLGCGGVVATYRILRTEAFVMSLHRLGEEECVGAFAERDRLLAQFLDGFRVAPVGDDRLMLTHDRIKLMYRAVPSA